MEFIADENFSGLVIRGLRRRYPDISIVTVQEVGLDATADPDLLEWAAKNERVVVTHDVKTMVRFAKERVMVGKRMPGLVEAGRRLTVRGVIEDLAILATCSLPGEWEAQVIYLPLSRHRPS